MPNSNRRPGPGSEPAPPPAADEPAEPAEPAEPLNRAERRAQRKGRRPALPPEPGKGPPAGHHEQVVVPRRSGRRGNR